MKQQSEFPELWIPFFDSYRKHYAKLSFDGSHVLRCGWFKIVELLEDNDFHCDVHGVVCNAERQ
jgi:hypothetical protein